MSHTSYLTTISHRELPQRPCLFGCASYMQGSGECVTSPEVGYRPGESMETMELSHRPISIHNFSDKICDKLVHFHVMSLQDCFFLWVGFSARLCNLAVSMCSRFVSVFTVIISCPSSYIYIRGKTEKRVVWVER